MSELILLVGPPGSGKSTYQEVVLRNNPDMVVISQDDQGKAGHMDVFRKAIENAEDIIIDRMNFSKLQRSHYLIPAKTVGYHITIVVLHESQATCLERMLKRTGHPTIQDDGSMLWLTPGEVAQFATERGFDMVPVLYDGPYNLAMVKKLSEGPSVLCPEEKVREGCVVKLKNDYSMGGNKQALKVISEAYLDDKTNTDEH
jgi:ABC-type dipeptide/oligopeptide/nickel transport system ATPase component